MECPKCSSKVTKNGTDLGRQKYRCTACKHSFVDHSSSIVKHKVGMSLDEFKERFDVDYIVQKTLDKLEANMIYEENEVKKLTGLRPGFPGLTDTLKAAKEYQGRAGGSVYFSHPDTIKRLKDDAKMT